MTGPVDGRHLAQLNIARAVAPLDDPAMADFVADLDRINHLAEASPGFVWRLKDETDSATSIRAFDDPLVIVNLTVWTSVETLREYAYGSAHVEVFRRRREWFEKLDGPNLVLWWIPSGQVPSLDEARHRLAQLGMNGPTRDAFTLRTPFVPTG
jgi:hypothetical protein